MYGWNRLPLDLSVPPVHVQGAASLHFLAKISSLRGKADTSDSKEPPRSMSACLYQFSLHTCTPRNFSPSTWDAFHSLQWHAGKAGAASRPSFHARGSSRPPTPAAAAPWRRSPRQPCTCILHLRVTNHTLLESYFSLLYNRANFRSIAKTVLKLCLFKEDHPLSFKIIHRWYVMQKWQAPLQQVYSLYQTICGQ